MSLKPSQAMILAAGFGKRMLPITSKIPKPLVLINKKPILQHIIEKIICEDIDEIIINSHHLSKKINSFLDSKDYKSIKVSYEKDILETGGGVSEAIKRKFIGNKGPFFIINGDIFWLEDESSIFSKLTKYWDEGLMDILLVLVKKQSLFGYRGNGDFNFLESEEKFGKITNVNVKKEFVYTGVQLLNPKVFEYHKEKKFSFSKVFNRAIENKTLYGIVDNSRWFHIGTVESLKKINRLV